MPRSALAARLFEILSPVGTRRENPDLISCQRVAKSASPWAVSRPRGVIGQYRHRIDRERMAPAGLAKCATQRLDVLRQQT
jgi:hypothetical protein